MSRTDEPHECEWVTLFAHEDVRGPEHWHDIRRRVVDSVAGVEPWRVVVPRWLAEMTADGPPPRVQVGVRHRCDLIRCLLAEGPPAASQFLPTLRVRLRHADGERRLHSRLEWTGREVALVEEVRAVYPDPADWVRARRAGTVLDSDERLLARLGLVHTLVEESTGENAAGPRLVTVDARARRLVRTAPVGDKFGSSVWADRQHVRGFFRRYRAELDQVVTEFAEFEGDEGHGLPP